jgi:uncharacterized protein (TIGR02217 family)
VARDGFTHFTIGEAEMQAFDDVQFPIEIGRQATAIPEFSTNIVTTFSGYEHRNSRWSDARQTYDVGPGIRSEQELGILLEFFRARRGAAKGFRFTDPFDFSSRGMTEIPTVSDQQIGIGDSLQTRFALVKHYGAGEDKQERRITRPRPESLLIGVNGVTALGWSLDALGLVVFETAPEDGATITAGFYFDVPVRFAEDSIELNRATFGAGEIASVPLVEHKEAV